MKKIADRPLMRAQENPPAENDQIDYYRCFVANLGCCQNDINNTFAMSSKTSNSASLEHRV